MPSAFDGGPVPRRRGGAPFASASRRCIYIWAKRRPKFRMWPREVNSSRCYVVQRRAALGCHSSDTSGGGRPFRFCRQRPRQLLAKFIRFSSISVGTSSSHPSSPRPFRPPQGQQPRTRTSPRTRHPRQPPSPPRHVRRCGTPAARPARRAPQPLLLHRAKLQPPARRHRQPREGQGGRAQPGAHLQDQAASRSRMGQPARGGLLQCHRAGARRIGGAHVGDGSTRPLRRRARALCVEQVAAVLAAEMSHGSASSPHSCRTRGSAPR